MAAKVFIDGHAGTTGLRIRDWLSGRPDIAVLEIEEALRKDTGARLALAREADVAVLCLPDEAAREVAEGVADGSTRLLDASTAHRVAEGWTFGLPEAVPGQRERIAQAKNVSNPGCYPTAVILLVRPLVDGGLLGADAPLTVHALSGYSGGGRQKIEQWESPELGLERLPFEAPYAIDTVHKHIPEMTRYAGLEHEPQFIPAVGPFYSGMRVQVPLHASVLAAGVTAKSVWETLTTRYDDEPFVDVVPFEEPLAYDEQTFDPRACNDTNRIELRVVASPLGHVLLLATLDNLGKGAAGVAIQNLNLMLGLPETTGLPGALGA